MKLNLAFAALVFATSCLASTNINQRKINLMAKDLTSAEFMAEISKQAQVKFVVDPGAELPRHISFVEKNAPLKQIMDKFALRQDVIWEATDENTIRISAPQKR